MERLLTIAGSDSSGGAGIQADLKVMAALECYGMSVITAVTAQNTCDVFDIQMVSNVQKQIDAVIADIGVDAIKIGMLPSIDVLENLPKVPIVLDPVMVSTSGDRLVSEGVKFQKLFSQVTLITPNLFETECLTRMSIRTEREVEEAGEKLLDMGARNVLIKGGDRKNGSADDCLIAQDRVIWFRQKAIESRNTHGTGCTLSSAIACFLAKGFSLTDAIRLGKAFVTECLIASKDIVLGKGSGPVMATPLPVGFL